IFRAQFTPVSFSLLFSSFPEDPSYPSRGRGTRGFSEPDSTFQPRKRGVAPTALYALQRRRSHSWKLVRRGGFVVANPRRKVRRRETHRGRPFRGGRRCSHGALSPCGWMTPRTPRQN